MNTAALIVVIIVAVIIVVGIGLALARQAQRRRSERLRQHFGPEYERVVGQTDDRRAAEAELAAREKRHRRLELRQLDDGQRSGFERRWSDVQAGFVDDPSRAVSQADHLVVEVMAARGYPVDDFDQRADDLSVQYPEVTSRYREARRVARANERGEASTEDLRDAVTSYRALVHALLRDEDGRGGERAGGARGGDVRADADRADADRADAGGVDAGRADAGRVDAGRGGAERGNAAVPGDAARTDATPVDAGGPGRQDNEFRTTTGQGNGQEGRT